MTPETRRAHLILHGQTLLDEWTQRCKLRAEGRKLWAEGTKLYAEGNKLYAEGNKIYAEGNKLWADAVLAEFGPACTITWDGNDCILSVGERYDFIT